MRNGWAWLVVSAMFLATPMAVANHPQSAHGDVLVFDHKTGNEWWVEVVLSGGSSGFVSGVQAMDTGGAWVPLTLRSWGAWAASFHIEPGHQVKFRASWAGGDMVESCWFDHPSGIERCSAPPPGPFDATFTGVRGNEWWVQGNVATNGPTINRVDVRLDGGAWQPLTKQSWGLTAWAASYHIVQGTIVQMRATATDGQTDLSSCRQWIPASGQDATIVACPGTPPPPPPPSFDATFSSVKGNEWWVEAVVRANEPIQVVFLMINCDTTHDPHDMVYRADWGKWVLGATHIAAGSVITMTAHGDSGADTSATYLWPQGTIVDDCPPAWPQEGSHADVRFRDELRSYDEGGERYFLADGLVHVEWTGSAWDGTCQQRVTRMAADGTWSNVTETYAWDQPPPTSPTPARVGDLAEVQTVTNGCRLAVIPDQTVVGRERRTFTLRTSSGDPIPIDAYHASESDIGGFSDYWWDTRLGLMLDWNSHSSGPYHSGSSRGWLLDTDAGFYPH